MQKQPNTFAAPAVQILHFLCVCIGIICFFIGDGDRSSVFLFVFVCSILLFPSIDAVAVLSCYCVRGWVDAPIQTVSGKSPLLCIALLHRHINRIDSGNNRGFFQSKYSFFRNKPGQGLPNPYQTLMKPLASTIQAP